MLSKPKRQVTTSSPRYALRGVSTLASLSACVALLGCASKSKEPSRPPAPTSYVAPHCDDATEDVVDVLCLLGKTIPDSMTCSPPRGRTNATSWFYQWSLCKAEGKEFALYQLADKGNGETPMPNTPISALAFDVWQRSLGDDAPALADLVQQTAAYGCVQLESPAPTETDVVIQCQSTLAQFSKSRRVIEIKAGTESWFRTYYEGTGRKNPPKLKNAP